MTKTSQYLRNVGAMFRLLGRSQRLGILLRVLSLFCGVAIPFVIIKYQRALVENIEAGTGEKNPHLCRGSRVRHARAEDSGRTALTARRNAERFSCRKARARKV